MSLTGLAGALEVSVAYFMAHASQGSLLLPLLNGGKLAVLYCFAFLYFALAGGGAWSVDSLRGKTHGIERLAS